MVQLMPLVVAPNTVLELSAELRSPASELPPVGTLDSRAALRVTPPETATAISH